MYPDLRDDFLVQLPKERDEVEWLVRVGAYVQHCWLAENKARLDASDPAAVKEIDLWPLWDECTEAQIENIQVEALEMLADYRRRKTLAVLGGWAKEQFKPVRVPIKGIGWAAMQAWRGFWSAFGLVVFGLVFLWAAEGLVKRVRGAVDTVLPSETRPYQPTGDPASRSGAAAAQTEGDPVPTADPLQG